MAVLLTAHMSGVQLTISAAVVLFSIFVVKLIRHRLEWRSLRLPGPPHSMLFGSLKAMGEMRELSMKEYGPNVHPDLAGHLLAQKYGNGVVAVDLWPITPPIIIVSDAAVADKVVRSENLPKATDVMFVDNPVVGDESMVLLNSDPKSHAHWQRLRKSFSPAFAKGKLERNWTKDIVQEVGNFTAVLTKAAQNGSLVRLNDELNNVTVDIILRVALSVSNVDFRNKVLEVLNSQIDECSRINPALPILSYGNPLWHLRNWRRNRAMANLLHPFVAKHMEEQHSTEEKDKVDLLEEALRSGHIFTEPDLICQMRTFLFAGSDTTGSTLTWICYYLQQDVNRSCLQRIREEHDTVFGKHTVGDEGRLMSENPGLLSDLKYTTAVIKEALRLRPPASSARRLQDGDWTFSCNGEQYRAGCNAYFWVLHYSIHRNPAYFDNPESFLPERYLDEKGDLAASGIAWQPFSRGPKNCIGLELAMLEMRAILAMIVRKFDFEYTDDVAPHSIYRLTARPSNGIPMRVRVR